jgi:glutaminyl-peptide cyclotransferase
MIAALAARPGQSLRWASGAALSMAALMLVLAMGACLARPKNESLPSGGSLSATSPWGAAVDPSRPIPEHTAAPAFDSTRAFQYVKEIVAFGPRPIGSQNHKKVENYIVSHLRGDDIDEDSFEIHPQEGSFPVRNLIAKFPGERPGIVVIASHYDTNWPLRNTSYVGANDGASSSALLMEIRNQLHGKKLSGYSVWLVWDDAEESMKLPWDDPEALYGVRHLAQKWKEDGTLKQIKGFLLEDMVGDSDLNIERVTNSTPWLEDLVFEAARQLGYQSHFFAREMKVEDDHQPFLERGVPATDLIDFHYGYNNVFWHTTEDTVDKLSPQSLAIVGTVTLETVRLINQR